ncbi:MAG TPA: putative toxin-antitoxin system toxin component, PIN family [Oculatellaceae cyanobacterium]
MRVVIDTSTFIKAILERDRIAWNCIRNLMVSSFILMNREMAKELFVAIYQVAGRKGKNPLPAFRIASSILLYVIPVETETKFPWCSDPDDAMFVECAIDGKADLVISNDHSLTGIKEYVVDEHAMKLICGIKFVTPAEYLKMHTG